MATRNLSAVLSLPALTVSAGLKALPRIDATLALPALSVSATLVNGGSGGGSGGGTETLSADLGLSALSITADLKALPRISADLSLPSLVIESALSVAKPPARIVFNSPWVLSTQVTTRHRTLWHPWASDAARLFTSTHSLSQALPPLEFISICEGPRKVQSLASSYSCRTALEFESGWKVGSITAQLSSPYGMRVSRAVLATWKITAPLSVSLKSPWAGAVPIQKLNSTNWSIRLSRVTGLLQGYWAISSRDSASIMLSSHWSLLNAATTIPLPNYSLTQGQSVLDVESLSLVQSRDEGAWQLQASVIGANRIPIGAPITLDLAGTAYHLIVTAAQAAEINAADRRLDITAKSPASQLSGADLALRDDVSAPYDGWASQLAALAAQPFALDWQLPDWYLTPPMVSVWLNQPAYIAAAKLARAAGGVLLSNPDGSLMARKEIGSSIGEFEAIEAQFNKNILPTGVEIRSATIFDSIAIEGDGDSRVIRVTPAPWREVSARIVGSGSVLGPAELEAVEKTETIVFSKGIAALTAPMLSIISTVFFDEQARDLNYVEHESFVWLNSPDNAIATLVFSSQAIRHELVSTGLTPVYLVVEDTDE